MVHPEIVLLPDRIDPNRMLFDGIDTSGGPEFSVGQMSKFFFARSPYWYRSLEARGKLESSDSVPERRTPSGARTFNLGEVEAVAYILVENGVIDLRRLQIALLTLWLQGSLHGYLK